MDPAVALVQAYLHVNGYLTLCEDPVLEDLRRGGMREATDLDVLAIRFPGSRASVVRGRGTRRLLQAAEEVDPALGVATDRPDMLIGEVKEGVPVLNGAARHPGVLAVALRRFGCCDDRAVDAAVEDLLAAGEADLPSGHRARLVAFGLPDPRAPRPRGFRVVSLVDAVEHVCGYLSRSWAAVHHVRWKDPTLALFALLEKVRRARSAAGAASSVDGPGAPR